MGILGAKLATKMKIDKRGDFLWKGPRVDGITQSKLSLFFVCRKRFGVSMLYGWKAIEAFSVRMEFGQMWHLCEEIHLAGGDWEKSLLEFCKSLAESHREAQEEIDKWYRICRMQFPIYLDYWASHKDTYLTKNLLQEVSFRIPYLLPSGNTVWLRGKWDSIDLVAPEGEKTLANARVYVQDHKTKGDINEQRIVKQLKYDLQTMFYVLALEEFQRRIRIGKPVPGMFPAIDSAYARELVKPLGGIRYNVIRRPLSGGRGTIKQHQATKNKPEETKEEFLDRLRDEYIQSDPAYYFMRWKVDLHKGDIDKFRKDTLIPALEQLCVYYDIKTDPNATQTMIDLVEFRLPYGIYNPIAEGLETMIDGYLATGSTLGLKRVENLFPELETT